MENRVNILAEVSFDIVSYTADFVIWSLPSKVKAAYEILFLFIVNIV